MKQQVRAVRAAQSASSHFLGKSDNIRECFLKKKQTKNGCSLDSKLHGRTDYLAYGWHDELFAKCGRNSVLFNALSAVRIAALSVILPHTLIPVCCYSLEPMNSSK